MASSELAVQSISEIAEPLMYVEKSGGGYGGWRVELLSARVLSKSEEKLILCVSCGGLLREASLWERGEKQGLRCYVCLPKDIYMLNVRAAEMIREAINERQVNCPLKKCKWESSMDKLRHHLEEECPFLSIPLPFHCLPPVAEGKCSANGVERRLMNIHKKEVCPIRLIRCVFCDKKVENCQIIAHQEQCPFVPIPCPLKCLRPVTERKWSVNRVESRPMDIHKKEVCPRKLIRCVFCDKKVESCQIIAHQEECPFVPIPCPLKCLRPVTERKWSVNRVERGLIDIHTREVCPRRLIRCEFCDKEIESCQIIAHQEECPFLPIPCPLKCLPVAEREWSVNRVERGLMDMHIKVCSEKLIRCEFCDKEFKRCQMDAHLEECEDYLILCPNACPKKNRKILLKRRDLLRHVTEECSLQKMNCKGCGAEIERFVLEKHEIALCPMRVKSGQVRWKIGLVKNNISFSIAKNGPSLDASGYKFDCRISFNDRNSGYVGCYVRILRGHRDSFLTWPFRGRYTFTLINHENEDESHSHCLIAGKDEDPIQHFSKPISHSNGWWGEARFIDRRKLLTKKYLQNDSITLDIRVDAIC